MGVDASEIREALERASSDSEDSAKDLAHKLADRFGGSFVAWHRLIFRLKGGYQKTVTPDIDDKLRTFLDLPSMTLRTADPVFRMPEVIPTKKEKSAAFKKLAAPILRLDCPIARAAVAEKLATRTKAMRPPHWLAAPCLLYGSGASSGRVPRMNIGKRNRISVARAAYMLIVGPIPENHAIEQLCGRHNCVALSHLAILPANQGHTVRPNSTGGRERILRVCRKGHSLDGARWRTIRGKRRLTWRCQTCQQIANQRSRQRQKELRLTA